MGLKGLFLMPVRGFLLLYCIGAGLPGCSGSSESSDSLAARGEIDSSAPIKATATLDIRAPQAKVWGVLADIAHWPAWQPDITDVTLVRSPAQGVDFSWSLDGTNINSRIAVFEPNNEIGWNGRVWHIRAIHIWTLTSLPDGSTRVETRESMRGWPIEWLYSSNELLDSNRQWLARLKTAAEK